MHADQDSAVLTEGQAQRDRILIVEDDLTFEAIWEHIIHQASRYALVEWVTSVNEAEKKIEASLQSGRPYELVISDIHLSGKQTGIDLWRRFQNRFHDRFLLVSSADHLTLLKSLRDYAEPIYIQKPILIPEAITLVYDLLRR